MPARPYKVRLTRKRDLLAEQKLAEREVSLNLEDTPDALKLRLERLLIEMARNWGGRRVDMVPIKLKVLSDRNRPIVIVSTDSSGEVEVERK